MKQKMLIINGLFILSALGLHAQEKLLQSGPMVGYSTMREVQLWVQTTQAAKVQFSYWEKAGTGQKYHTAEALSRKEDAFAVKLLADQIQPGKVYTYELYIDGTKVERPYPLTFRSQALWQWRSDPPEVTFVTGSCAYVNDAAFDRPGKPHGGDYGIFEHMRKDQPDFMLWLGDNTYLREADWGSWTGILHRYTHTRSLPELQAFFGSVHHYAIWDDHDYGPNDSDRGFWNKSMTTKAFDLFWANPNGNITGQGGITGTFVWGDIQFFLLDDRTFRSPKQQQTGKKEIIGEAQLQWLKDALTYSEATFKFIVIGGQVLNTAAVYENYANFPEERQRLLDAVHDSGAGGVIFLTGDRHHTELSKLDRDGAYPLYDFTISPLTSGLHDPGNEENELYVEGTLVYDHRNYAVMKVTGPLKDRKLQVMVKSEKGKVLWEKELRANSLK